MTKAEFDALADRSQSPLPVKLADGRFGLANHCNASEALVDPMPANADGLAIHIVYEDLTNVGNGALLQRGASL